MSRLGSLGAESASYVTKENENEVQKVNLASSSPTRPLQNSEGSKPLPYCRIAEFPLAIRDSRRFHPPMREGDVRVLVSANRLHRGLGHNHSDARLTFTLYRALLSHSDDPLAGSPAQEGMC